MLITRIEVMETRYPDSADCLLEIIAYVELQGCPFILSSGSVRTSADALEDTKTREIADISEALCQLGFSPAAIADAEMISTELLDTRTTAGRASARRSFVDALRLAAS